MPCSPLSSLSLSLSLSFSPSLAFSLLIHVSFSRLHFKRGWAAKPIVCRRARSPWRVKVLQTKHQTFTQQQYLAPVTQSATGSMLLRDPETKRRSVPDQQQEKQRSQKARQNGTKQCRGTCASKERTKTKKKRILFHSPFATGGALPPDGNKTVMCRRRLKAELSVLCAASCNDMSACAAATAAHRRMNVWSIRVCVCVCVPYRGRVCDALC